MRKHWKCYTWGPFSFFRFSFLSSNVFVFSMLYLISVIFFPLSWQNCISSCLNRTNHWFYLRVDLQLYMDNLHLSHHSFRKSSPSSEFLLVYFPQIWSSFLSELLAVPSSSPSSLLVAMELHPHLHLQSDCEAGSVLPSLRQNSHSPLSRRHQHQWHCEVISFCDVLYDIIITFNVHVMHCVSIKVLYL